MNAHDSEKMLGLLEHEGYVKAGRPEEADLIIFNTCAIREKAEQKFYSQLGRVKKLKQKRKDLKIAVAGCVAQETGAKIFRRAPHVDYVLGPQHIHRLGGIVSHGSTTAMTEEDTGIAYHEFETRRNDPFRAWVNIMYGCDNFCSYCIVPYTRGREVSRPSASVVAEVRDLVRRGYREVTLLGQNVNSYRSDVSFVELLKKIDSTGISRVRFMTSHPRDLSPELVDAVAELGSVCEHFHLPLQSASDAVLGMMNRGYTFDEYRRKIDLLRRRVPGISITTDIIVGFPGERDEDFFATLQAVRDVRFDGIFGFKYSRRKGTAACTMAGQVEDSVKSERLSRILELQDDITLENNRRLEGSLLEVLVEGAFEHDPSLLSGRSRSNKIVAFKGPAVIGELRKVRIRTGRRHSLIAELLPA